MPVNGKILVYGYGNPGRQDDALGNACVDALQEWCLEEGLTHVSFDSNYQLNIEDSDTISGYGYVVFVDASQEEIEDFILTKVEPSAKTEFSMHAVSPGFVLNLCSTIFEDVPETYLLHIKGYEWELKEELCKQAEINLENALDFLKPLLINPDLLKDNIDN